ncbi:alanine racemase [Arboricoccus pini]|uniref:Alanine racemase n=2 Tax=Arboricoccus pini TaxID=1963835 RepID=A0A212R7H7_9PROT|nr:alanine racemase [Arboricoccus pini]
MELTAAEIDAAAGAVLTVDLDAVVANYRLLTRMLGGRRCAAVVKADAYGLGAEPVARKLQAAGCRHFFVAHLTEALSLRPVLDKTNNIFVLNGLNPGSEIHAVRHNITPVLNSIEQLHAWRQQAMLSYRTLPAVLQLDTGMSRLGLSQSELDSLIASPHYLEGIDLQFVMSHLACADEPDHPANRMQLENFVSMRRHLPAIPASFANSAGIFLGSAYQADLGRPGIALYGAHPGANRSTPLSPAVKLEAKIVQLREIEAGAGVGYGHAFISSKATRLATISVGYADGWMRSLSGRGCAFLDDQPLPIVGRVSMDSMTLDVSMVPPSKLRPGALVELIGPHQSVDDIAAHAGTIGYEILTGLGTRYARRYRGIGSDEATARTPGAMERTEIAR